MTQGTPGQRPSSYISKAELDRLVAAKLGINAARLKAITNQLYHEMMLQLVAGKGITIPTFGDFWMQVQRPGPRAVHLKKGVFKKGESNGVLAIASVAKHQVHFKKGSGFKKMVLEKYGKAQLVKENKDA